MIGGGCRKLFVICIIPLSSPQFFIRLPAISTIPSACVMVAIGVTVFHGIHSLS
ncbi:hypothetical protein BCR42DRAFT_429323, partial [Absidia repens]